MTNAYRLSKYTPPKRAMAAIGVKFSGWGMKRETAAKAMRRTASRNDIRTSVD
jgi:hypothetical protein